jgi:hypothetical protein
VVFSLQGQIIGRGNPLSRWAFGTVTKVEEKALEVELALHRGTPVFPGLLCAQPLTKKIHILKEEPTMTATQSTQPFAPGDIVLYRGHVATIVRLALTLEDQRRWTIAYLTGPYASRKGMASVPTHRLIRPPVYTTEDPWTTLPRIGNRVAVRHVAPHNSWSTGTVTGVEISQAPGHLLIHLEGLSVTAKAGIILSPLEATGSAAPSAPPRATLEPGGVELHYAPGATLQDLQAVLQETWAQETERLERERTERLEAEELARQEGEREAHLLERAQQDAGTTDLFATDGLAVALSLIDAGWTPPSAD